MSDPLMTFKSHISGKNADVAIFNDRIEWGREGRFSGGKAGLAVMTGGLSLAAKAGRTSSKGAGTEMIPIRSISSVTTKKDGLRFWAVSIVTSGNTIDMRVTKEEADQAKGLLTQLMLAPASPAPVAAPAPAAPAEPDSMDQLKKLAELHQAGVLTDEEFAAKKAQLLGL